MNHNIDRYIKNDFYFLTMQCFDEKLHLEFHFLLLNPFSDSLSIFITIIFTLQDYVVVPTKWLQEQSVWVHPASKLYWSDATCKKKL